MCFRGKGNHIGETVVLIPNTSQRSRKRNVSLQLVLNFGEKGNHIGETVGFNPKHIKEEKCIFSVNCEFSRKRKKYWRESVTK